MCNIWNSPGSKNVTLDTDRRNNIFIFVFLVPFLCRAQLWVERLVPPCNAEHARKLPRQYVCSHHFSGSDFTLGDETCLDRLAFLHLCTAASHPSSAQHHGGPSSNSSSCEEDLHVLVPTNTYYPTKSIISLTKEPLQIWLDTSIPSVVSPEWSLPAETSMTPLFPLTLQLKELLL